MTTRAFLTTPGSRLRGLRCLRGLRSLRPWLALAALLLCGAAAAAGSGSDKLHIGSKRFTESYILGAILTQTAAPFARTEYRPGLGNTAVVFEALKAGAIDLYPEYLGTIEREILHRPPDAAALAATPTAAAALATINRALAPLGLGAAVPLGFNNTYALALRDDPKITAIRSLSQLAQHPEIRLGLSHEFLGRADGWPGLARRYQLPQQPRGLDHGIAYEALAAGQVDAIDIYSTDAKIRRYHLRVLQDDLDYFPRYDALLLYRLDLASRFPQAWQALQGLQGKITEADMIAMNAAAELDGQSFAAIAAAFVAAHPDASAGATGAAATITATVAPTGRNGLWQKLFAADLGRLTRQHALLVLVSVTAACLLGIPLGILAAFAPRLRQSVMATAGVLQTIPSLALLALLIPLLGMIGTLPALIALFLYALLPIVRNTCTGILQVPGGLRLAALALGLTPRQRLWQIDLPLALPVMLAGIQTAAVMSVGTATIAAFIGAGGYGERIAVGLALNDNDMLLAGAIPAAVFALATQGLFELVEWALLRRRRQAEGKR
jgi:osmoprotectant transport system permease protein